MDGNFGYAKSFHSFVGQSARHMDMKERIMLKAKDLFHRYGFKSVTMDEIATQLGVSKKTIYQYYSDKDELVRAVVGQTIHHARSTCEQYVGMANDAVHEMYQGLEIGRQIITDMNPSTMYDLERFHPQAYQLFLDHKNNFLHQFIRSNIQRGIEEGLYRPDLNIDVIAKLRLEGIMLAFNHDLFPQDSFNMVKAQEIILEHFLFGVASLKGYKLIQKYQQERNKS